MNIITMFFSSIWGLLLYVLSVLLLLMIIIVLYIYMGTEGRFFFLENLIRKKGAILMGVHATGQTILKHVKSKGGHSLRSGKTGFYFLPKLINEEDVQAAQHIEGKHITQLNDLVRNPSWMASKPFYLANLTASMACNRSLTQALELAQQDADYSTRAKDFFKELVKAIGEGVREVFIIEPMQIDTLAEYVNISYTQDDIEETYQEGYIEGLKTNIRNMQVMTVILVIMAIGWLLTIFWLSK